MTHWLPLVYDWQYDQYWECGHQYAVVSYGLTTLNHGISESVHCKATWLPSLPSSKYSVHHTLPAQV